MAVSKAVEAMVVSKVEEGTAVNRAATAVSKVVVAVTAVSKVVAATAAAIRVFIPTAPAS